MGAVERDVKVPLAVLRPSISLGVPARVEQQDLPLLG